MKLLSGYDSDLREMENIDLPLMPSPRVGINIIHCAKF
jgi:hypothetical protein